MPHFWDFMNMGGLMTPIAIIALILVLFRVLGTGSKMIDGFTTEAPAFVIPKRNRGQVRSDGTEIRTVRLPNKCSNCGALLTQSDIQWVGPLEAECNYCGSTARAQFEKV